MINKILCIIVPIFSFAEEQLAELPDLNYMISRSTKLEMNEIPTESLPDLEFIYPTIDEEEEKPQLLEEIPLVEDES